MKPTLTLTALLLLNSLALAAVPSTAPFTKTVDLTATSQTTLPVALSTLGRSIGVNLIVQNLPNVNVTQSIRSVPAWQAINTLIRVHAPEHDTHYDGKFLIIAPKNTIATLRGENRVTEMTGVALDEKQTASLTTLIPGLIVLPFGTANVLSGTPEQVRQAQTLLSSTATKSPTTQLTLDVTPMTPTTLSGILKDAFTDLRTVNAGTRLVISGPTQTVTEAQTLIDTLIQDAKRDAAAAEKTPAPAVVIAATPAAPDTTRRADLKLDAQTIARLSALHPSVRLTPLDSGAYLMTGPAEDVTALHDEFRLAESRLNARALVSYPLKRAGKDIIAVLQRAVPAASFDFIDSSRQLLVRAIADEHTLIATLLRQLDVTPTEETEREVITKTVTLEFAKASDLAPVLSSPSGNRTQASNAAQAGQNAPAETTMAQGQGAPNTQQGQAQDQAQGQGQANPGLTITVDERSNALVLRGPRNEVNTAMTLAATLDRELPNVAVHVKVQQVDNSDGSNLGIDWSIGAGGLNVGGGGNGLSVAYTPGAVAPTARVNLNAQDTRTKGKTLLDTHLTTQSGRPGKLLSGGTLMLPKYTTDGDGKTSISDYAQYDYGLEVRITPRATRDNRVELIVTTIIGEPPTFGSNGSISLNKRQVDTIVTLRPTESVTLGGVITTSELQQNQGVPFLSQIPIIGALFSKNVTSKGNAVLLMTITADANLIRMANANASAPDAAPTTPSQP